MTTTGTSIRTPVAAGWLYGPVPDLVLGCGLGSVVIMAALAFWGASISAIVPASLLVMVFSLPHYGATLLRVYELPEDRHKYSFFAIWCTLAIAASLFLGLRYAFFGSLILTLYLTWSPWHYTGQNYGIFLILLARRGVAISPTAKRLVYASFALSYALAFLAIHGFERSSNYAPVSYSGTIYQLIPLGMPAALSTPLVYATATGYLASLIGAVVLLLRAGSLAQIAPSLVVFGTQALWFSVPVLVRYWGDESTAQSLSGVYNAYGFLWIAAAHAVQYLWVTTYYATSRPKGSSGSGASSHPDPSRPPSRVRYLATVAFAGFAIWTLPVLIFAPGALGSLPHESGLALLVAATVNLHHFVLDGVVWKLRDGRVAQILLRSGGPVSAAASPAAEASRPRRGVSWASRSLWATGAACVALGLFATWEEDVGFQQALVAGNTLRARTAVDRLAMLGRDGPKRRTLLGRHLARNGDYRAARRQFQRGLALHATAESWLAMALLHEQDAAWGLAARAHEAAIAIDAHDPASHYRLGVARLEAGQPVEAVRALEVAAELAPDHKLIQVSLARARREVARALQLDQAAGARGAEPAAGSAPADRGQP